MPGDMSMAELARLEEIKRAMLTDAERIAEDQAKSDYAQAYMRASEELQALLDEAGLGRP